MKPTVIDPNTTTRAEAYALWMNAPNPMVTFFKTLDVTPLVRLSRKRGLKFNMLLCWCIGKAASQIKEFYLLPFGRELLQYDSIAVNAIVKNKTGEVSSCDVPFSNDLAQFSADYLRLTHEVAESCENHDLLDRMVIGTDGRHARPDGGAVPLLRPHSHGRRTPHGAGLPERRARAEPCRVLRRALRARHHAIGAVAGRKGHPPAGRRRVFDNILSNAAKYSDGDLAVVLAPDGEVTFSNRASALSRV